MARIRKEKTIAAPSVHGQPLHLQLLEYVTQTSGATYQEMAVNFEVSVRSTRRAVRRLRRSRLVRCKPRHGRIEVCAAHPAIWRPGGEPSNAIHAADLFCGAGGFSTGLALALQALGKSLEQDVDLVAINHDEEAINSHKANHPWARHCREDIAKAQPRELFPGGRLHVLLCSPSCVHFSKARGGVPVNPQERTHAFQAIRWARDLDIDAVIVENVDDFVHWGPTITRTCLCERMKPCGTCKGAGGECKPCSGEGEVCKKCKGLGRYEEAVKDGSIFRAWLREWRLLGYNVGWKIINAADYGDATTRKRFFAVIVKQGRAVPWPKQTHSKDGKVPGTKPWRGAREIIDRSLEGKSVRFREKQLVIKTRRRIVKGIRQFWGPAFDPLCKAILAGNKEPVRIPVKEFLKHGLQPFMLQQQSGGEPREVDKPMPTIASGGAISLVEPDVGGFVVPIDQQGAGDVAHDGKDPLSTVTTKNRHAFVEPLVLDQYGGQDAWQSRITNGMDPIGAVTGSNRFGVLDPVVVGTGGPEGQGEPRSSADPLPTVLKENHLAVLDPAFVLPPLGYHARDGEANPPKRTREPLPTITAGRGDQIGLVKMFLLKLYGTSSIAAATLGQGQLVEPLVTEYYGNGGTRPVSEPLPTQSTHDRFALVVPVFEGDVLVDATLRMFKWHELSAAMGFPKSYRLSGSDQAKIKQIGNAVAVSVAEALTMALLQTGTAGTTTLQSFEAPGAGVAA